MIKIAKNLFQITPRNTPFTPRNGVLLQETPLLLQEMAFYSKGFNYRMPLYQRSSLNCLTTWSVG